MLADLRALLLPGVVLRAADPGAGAASSLPSVTVDDALAAEAARYAAQTANDFAAMERLFGDDLVYIHSSTAIDTKASFIESIRSGAVRYRRHRHGLGPFRSHRAGSGPRARPAVPCRLGTPAGRAAVRVLAGHPAPRPALMPPARRSPEGPGALPAVS